MFIERDGRRIELTREEVEAAYGELKLAQTSEEAEKRFVQWLEEKGKNADWLKDDANIDFDRIAKMFLRERNESWYQHLSTDALWIHVIEEYMNGRESVFKTAEELGLRTFKFIITEQFSETFEVEARNEDEARQMAEEMYASGEVRADSMTDSFLELER